MISSRQHTADAGSTQWFRSHDRLEHLRIKVNLKKIADKSLPLGSRIALRSSTDIPQTCLPPPLEMTVRWQEKVFSHREILRYATLHPTSPDNTPLENRYHRDVTELLTRGNTPESRVLSDMGGDTRLFTFTDPDDFVDADFATESISTSDLPVSTMAARIMNTRHRKRLSSVQTANHGKEIITDVPVHRDQPGTDVPFSEMHIMASFRLHDDAPSQDVKKKKKSEQASLPPPPPEKKTVFVEKRLCTIRVYASGAISMTPGLTVGSTCHRFDIRGTEVYEYTIQNDSGSLTEFEERREQQVFQEFYRRRSEIREHIVGNDFLPIKEFYTARANLFGEIVSAHGFAKDEIHIQYFIELPDHWASESQILAAFTQRSRTTWNRITERSEAHFALPFEAELFVRPDPKGEEVARWPRIFFEVSSLDLWNRHTVEGYGYVSVPSIPGVYDMEVPTWRPFGDYATRLRSFLIGGSPELEDIAYAAVPAGFNENHLSKFGFQTVTSGTVRVRLNTVYQSGEFCLKNSARNRTSEERFQHLPGNLSAISDAVLRARARLELLKLGRKID